LNPTMVAGGPGTLGRRVVARLVQAGRTVRVLSRHSREPQNGVAFVTGDLATGEGVETALDRAGIIVHCADTDIQRIASNHPVFRIKSMRNIRASGAGELRLGGRREPIRVIELSDAEKPELLRDYLRRWKWEAGQFFDGVDAQDPRWARE
jgi:NAD(P)-dependent dehydrogenase (short-subunit alcohol dehydrogenase family)